MGVAANTGCSSVAFDGASWLVGLLVLLGKRRRR